jgi:hypothetical protein
VIRPLREQPVTGPELAGPAVDPAVMRAAMSGLAVPGTSSGAGTATAIKKPGTPGRGPNGNELG